MCNEIGSLLDDPRYKGLSAEKQRDLLELAIRAQPGAFAPADWQAFLSAAWQAVCGPQAQAASSTGRVRKFREKQRAVAVSAETHETLQSVSCNAENVSCEAPEIAFRGVNPPAVSQNEAQPTQSETPNETLETLETLPETLPYAGAPRIESNRIEEIIISNSNRIDIDSSEETTRFFVRSALIRLGLEPERADANIAAYGVQRAVEVYGLTGKYKPRSPKKFLECAFKQPEKYKALPPEQVPLPIQQEMALLISVSGKAPPGEAAKPAQAAPQEPKRGAGGLVPFAQAQAMARLANPAPLEALRRKIG